MNKQVEQLRAEIVRQKEYSRKMSVKANTNRMKYYFDGTDEMCNQLLNFIDSRFSTGGTITKPNSYE